MLYISKVFDGIYNAVSTFSRLCFAYNSKIFDAISTSFFGIYLCYETIVKFLRLDFRLRFVILRAKGGGLPLGSPGHEPAVCFTNVELSVCQERLSLTLKSRFGSWRGLSSANGFPRSRSAFRLSWCIRSKVGGCRCPCQGHVSSGVRFENNEYLGMAVSLRCRDVVPGIQNPTPLVLLFLYVVIRDIIVTVVVRSVDTRDWSLVSSRIHIPWE